MKPQNRRIIEKHELTSYLKRAILEWQMPDDSDIQKGEELLQARNKLKEVESESDFLGVLGLIKDGRQIDWAIKKILESTYPLYTDVDCAKHLVSHGRSLTDTQRADVLSIYVGVRIFGITIPDQERDELDIDLMIASAADIDALSLFMVRNRLVAPSEAEEMKLRWQSSDHLIGVTENEQHALNECLNLQVSSGIAHQTHRQYFNFGFDSRRIWRISEETVTLRVQFDLSQYPFDTHNVWLEIGAIMDADPSEIILYPSGSTDIDVNAALSPRGFSVNWNKHELEPVAKYIDSDKIPSSIVRYSFSIQRLAQAFVWRTLIPTLVIVYLGLVATAFAAATHQFVEGVLTQVIPAALIASVALQLTASQSIPDGAGRTQIDIFFVIIYLDMVLLYLVLQLVSSAISAWLLILAFGILIFCTAYYSYRFLKQYR